MKKPIWGIIAGTAFSRIPGLEVSEEGECALGEFGTAWLVRGKLGGVEVSVVMRHGRYHQHLPSEVNYLANLLALKRCGVTHLISVSAMGGINMRVGAIALVGPTIDKTTGRVKTIFGNGLVGHVARPTATCPDMRAHFAAVGQSMDMACFNGQNGEGAKLVVIDGPQFSSTAETEIHRSQGIVVVGMSTEPEMKLAAELGFSRRVVIGQVTDLDNPATLIEGASGVSQSEISSHAGYMNQVAAELITKAIAAPLDLPDLGHGALHGCILTKPEGIPPATTKRFCAIHGIDRIPPEWFAH